MNNEITRSDQVLNEADIVKESLVGAFKGILNYAKFENVAIFVDYDNVYHSLMKRYRHDPDHEDPSKNLFVQLWNRYGKNNVRTFRAYADFEQIRANLTSIQKKRVQIRHVYANGRYEHHRKNSSDIELCIDAIESTYKDDKISCYVFVTADSDMIPIMSRMMYKGKRVELLYLSTAASPDISNYAEMSYDLLDFLNVEIKEYDIKDYVVPALLDINHWYANNPDTRWLGTTILKNNLVRNLNLPDQECSDLIEFLKTEELTEEFKRYDSATRPRTSIRVSEKGQELIKQHEAHLESAAADDEKQN